MQMHSVFIQNGFVCKLIVVDPQNPLKNITNNTIYIGDYNTISVVNPVHYIFFQIEQYAHHFSRAYIKYMKHAKYILEYSQRNIHLYSHHINAKKIIYAPFMFTPLNNLVLLPKPKPNYKYDLAFYGTGTPRRLKIITHLANHFRVLVIRDFKFFHTESIAKLHSCAFLLNIHAFQSSAVLEIPRIHEGILHNIRIISERECVVATQDNAIYNKFIDFVDMVQSDFKNISGIVKRIRQIIKTNESLNVFYDDDVTKPLIIRSQNIFSKIVQSSNLSKLHLSHHKPKIKHSSYNKTNVALPPPPHLIKKYKIKMCNNKA
jgi:hypothetical protein